MFYCQWCKHKANRMDNLEAHLRLHTQPRPKTGGKRKVDFHPDAVAQYEQLLKSNESRRRKASKLKKRTASCM